MWLHAPNITCKHGFSNRYGGVSLGPFQSLNLGGSEDNPIHISENRERALKNLGLDPSALSTLKQVHGNTVCRAIPGAQEGDALVSDKKGQVLVVSIADCYPILFHDHEHGVIGAAHAGWRGTQAKIAETTLNAMMQLGAKPGSISVAIGQGISQDKFEVGPEVIEAFRGAGFPGSCWHENRVDLIRCNLFILKQNNILDKNIWTMNRCTFEPDFFSYRRDKGVTGRMWGLISL
jgi:YfiH family protein